MSCVYREVDPLPFKITCFARAPAADRTQLAHHVPGDTPTCCKFLTQQFKVAHLQAIFTGKIVTTD